MITNFNKIPDFDTYITEKSGVIERNIYNETNVEEISKIIGGFMSHIMIYPDDNYETHKMMFNELVSLKYIPTPNCESNGVTHKRSIIIYRQVNRDNYLDVKYTLAHEIVHMMHQILSKNSRPYEDLDNIGKLRHSLLEITSENIQDYKNSPILMLMIYMIDENEVYSRNQNAYIKAFEYKSKNDFTLSNQEIVSDVFNDIHMTNDYFNAAVEELKNNEETFSLVISFLIGNFFELGKSGFQQYFDKKVFNIPVVKKMKNEIRKSIHNKNDIKYMCRDVLDIIKKYKYELDEYKSEIEESFIEHMRYWFDNARKRLGKSISLGIEDATIN